jgi:hypothetical protein
LREAHAYVEADDSLSVALTGILEFLPQPTLGWAVATDSFQHGRPEGRSHGVPYSYQTGRALHKAALISFPSEIELQVWVQFNWTKTLNQIKKSSYLPGIVVALFDDVDASDGWDVFLKAGSNTDERPVFRDNCKSTLAVLSTTPPVGPPPQASATC